MKDPKGPNYYAEKIKEVIVEAGANDELPLDLTQLDASIFNDIVWEIQGITPEHRKALDESGFNPLIH